MFGSRVALGVSIPTLFLYLKAHSHDTSHAHWIRFVRVHMQVHWMRISAMRIECTFVLFTSRGGLQVDSKRIVIEMRGQGCGSHVIQLLPIPHPTPNCNDYASDYATVTAHQMKCSTNQRSFDLWPAVKCQVAHSIQVDDSPMQQSISLWVPDPARLLQNKLWIINRALHFFPSTVADRAVWMRLVHCWICRELTNQNSYMYTQKIWLIWDQTHGVPVQVHAL